MMSARPWFKFYGADWRSDSALRMCSLAARGLWLEMVCVMDEGTPRGHLVVKGKQIGNAQLAILSGCTPQEVGRLLQELEVAEVFSRNADGTIFSRRMLRETQVSDDQRRKANQRWAPEGGDLFDPGDGGGNAGSDTQSPESRVQNPESDARSAPASSRRKPETPIPDGFPDAEALTKAEEQISEARVILDPGRQAVRFRAHAETNDRRCRDWRAAWRNWVDKGIETAPVLVHSAAPEAQLTAAESAAIDLRKHRFWMEDWKKGNPWDRKIRGPRPDEIGCAVPAEIMAEFGHTPVRRAEG